MKLNNNQQAFLELVRSGLWEKDACLLLFGLILTDVVGGYVLEMDEDFEFWLPEDNRVMHIKELVVDGNINGMGNIVAKGEMASGGVGQPADFNDDN